MGTSTVRLNRVLSSEFLKMPEKEKYGQRTKGSLLLLLFAWGIVLLLGYSSPAQNLDTLAEVLRSGNTEQKREALSQLRNARSEEASRLAIRALRDKDPMVRATAAGSVVIAPRSEAAAALVPLLGDKDAFVRREAAFALGEVSDEATATYLMTSLTGDKDPEVRMAAAVALGKVGNPIAVSSLTVVLDQQPTEDNEMLKRAAARSIGQIAEIMRSGKVTVLTPQNFLPEKHKDIGKAASPDLIAHFGAAVMRLVKVLENSSEASDTRREAAFALGAIGDRSAEGVLNKYANSEDIYLAEIVKEALLKLRSSE